MCSRLMDPRVQLTHVSTLSRMLANIRKPYLDVHSRHPGTSSRTGERALDFSDLESSFLDRRHFTNEERDQIDLQVRVILTRCAERVKNMDALEKREWPPSSKPQFVKPHITRGGT